MKKIITGYYEDILILSGLVCIVIATFTLSFAAGLYMMGAVLFGLGLWFTVNPAGKG